MIEIGRHLIEAKQRVGHGHFLNWVKREFPDWSSRQTVANYIAVDERFSNVQATGLDPSICVSDPAANGGTCGLAFAGRAGEQG